MKPENGFLGNVRFISAGAGSGKTYRLTEELQKALTEGRANPSGIIGTTFTIKAAEELRERVRRHLIQNGQQPLANAMGQAMLGTVNSVCSRLLKRFAFETGLSPELQVLPEEEAPMLFNQALESAITLKTVRQMNTISERMTIDNWQAKVKAIVDTARANNMLPEDIRQHGLQSADQLLDFFPGPSARDLYKELEQKITAAEDGIESGEDATRGTQNYISLINRLKPAVIRRSLPWSQWVKLSKAAPTKKSLKWSDPIQEVAGQFASIPLLHQDIRQFCQIQFEIAAGSLENYQGMKKNLGLIDFVDQEQLLLKALQHPEVFATLRQELDLLLVDEFQDTSPIQLALFLKLASAAGETVLVGDVKQSIYGFRGCDPELMQTTLQAVMVQGGKTDVLKNSWRSRPELVAFTNEVFTTAFSDSLPEDQVRLIPVRKPLAGEPAVEHWKLGGTNKDMIALSLANGVEQLIASSQKIVEPGTEKRRDVRYGDIAVFARTNANVESLAAALSAAGIPVKRQRAGLTDIPEACLAIACLRRLADPTDTLASAEIISMSDCSEPETWLENRLKYLAEGYPGHLWGENDGYTHPVLRKLADNRDRLQFLTPVEALTLAINTADVRSTAVSWGPNHQRARYRLQNIDRLVEVAEEYEDGCRIRNQAATIAGFLLWLDSLSLAGLDMMPEDPQSNAVHLSTHHGAKGLEWPVVIATDLSGNLWSRLWDLMAESSNANINVNNPLADRRLRFWPWPFGMQSKGIAVAERIQLSEVGRQVFARDTAESRRLLYVSMTRARDLLILALPQKKPTGPWLETLGTDWMIPSAETLTLPDGTEIPTACRSLKAPSEATESDTADYNPFWLPAASTTTAKPIATVRPSAADTIKDTRVAETISIGDRIKIKGSPDMTLIGEAVHGIIAAEMINPNLPDAAETALEILNRFSVAENLDIETVLKAARNLASYVKTTLQPIDSHIEYPIEHVLENNQVVKGWIDMLLETDTGWIIIDHKTSSRPADELRKEALKYSGQLAAYKKAVEAATDKMVLSCWIHFPLAGCMVSIEV